MTQPHTTIYDVAKQAEVSPATVSRVFSNQPVVADKTRRRVLDAAERLQFTTNRVAAGLRRGRSDAISMVMPFNTPELMDAAQLAANDRRFTLMVHCTFKPDIAAEIRAIGMALEHQVAGLIWQPAGRPDDYRDILPRLKRSRTHVVMLERGQDMLPEADLVHHDTETAAREALDHLQQAGYRSIFHLSQDDGYVLRDRRREQFRRVAGERADVVTCSIEQVGQALEPVLRRATEPIGLYFDSDWLAFAAMSAIEAQSAAVPGEVGVMIQGDMLVGGRFRTGEMARPSLTAMQRQQATLAGQCIQRLLQRIESDAPPAPDGRRFPVPLRLVPRQSTNRQLNAAGAFRLGWPGGENRSRTLSHPVSGDH